MTDQPLELAGLSEAKSQQLLGWIYASLQAGKSVDAAEWNRAIITLTQRPAA